MVLGEKKVHPFSIGASFITCSFVSQSHCACVCISDVLDENQSKLSEDLMEFRRDASMLNVSVCALFRDTEKNM